TMSRIPFDRLRQPGIGWRPTQPLPAPDRLARTYQTVADNLISTQFAAMARYGARPRQIPRASGAHLDSLIRLLGDLAASLQFSEATQGDAHRFQLKMLQFMTSCSKRRDENRRGAYGGLTWWEFVGGDRYSPDFQREIETFVRTMVAMDARNGNARTIG